MLNSAVQSPHIFGVLCTVSAAGLAAVSMWVEMISLNHMAPESLRTKFSRVARQKGLAPEDDLRAGQQAGKL